MDGTLIDTEPYWMEAENDLIESHGGTWSDAQAFQLVGNALIVSGRIIKEQTGIPLTPEEIVDALLERVVVKLREHVPWRPGARELLLAARDAGLPCALVTMSYESFARVLVDSLPAGTFEVVVTGDMVEHGKPHPEPYLRAAHNLALAPEQCVAIEDSATGVRSAVAAGVPTLAVPHLVEIPQLDGLVVVPDLAAVSLDDLPRLAERARATR
ncbi:HAD family phosphatase [Dermacoccus abyssi]|nr:MULTISPECIES: HAD family phosphatase [Dermacoccus]MCT1987464.1 HAD family phosphatase [Dermacoccus abyssi]QNK54265.1 HAD family phosphatase [Dermacoccus sp. PAMC28757]RYI23949.1 HAD family phosphatase [Dermacoccus sp. 147Ba]